jgi:hypothetical protein
VVAPVAAKVFDRAVQTIEKPGLRRILLSRRRSSAPTRSSARRTGRSWRGAEQAAVSGAEKAAVSGAEKVAVSGAAEAAKSLAEKEAGAVAAKVAAEEVPIVNVVVAVGSAVSTWINAYKAYKRGDKRVYRLELTHSAFDLAGAIPGIGAGISLSGDVAFIVAVATLEKFPGTTRLYKGEDITAWVGKEGSPEVLKGIKPDERQRLLAILIEDADSIADVRAVRSLLYSSDPVDGPRLRDALLPHIQSSVNGLLNVKIRNLLYGQPLVE